MNGPELRGRGVGGLAGKSSTGVGEKKQCGVAWRQPTSGFLPDLIWGCSELQERLYSLP